MVVILLFFCGWKPCSCLGSKFAGFFNAEQKSTIFGSEPSKGTICLPIWLLIARIFYFRLVAACAFSAVMGVSEGSSFAFWQTSDSTLEDKHELRDVKTPRKSCYRLEGYTGIHLITNTEPKN